MGLLARIFGRSETRAAPDFVPQHFGAFGASGYNDSGVAITESNAVICSAVWACVSIIAQTISTLPIHVIRKRDGEKLYDHPLYNALSIQPNLYMTPAVFRETLLTNALLWGGAGAAITRDGAGNVESLYPLRSSDVRPMRRAGQLIYEARVGSNLYELTPDQIAYLLGWSMDGISPTSPIRSGMQAVATAVAMERYSAKAFNNSNVGGILQVPKMSDDAMKAFVESWRRNYAGIENAFKVAALPDPMKFIPTSMSPESATLTPARQNQCLEVARYYKVPPHLLGLMDKGSSFSSIEQQNMFFAQQCIQPWCVKLEQELSIKGLLERERTELEVRFNLDALLRASTQERYNAYNTGRQGGWLSINDIRRKESLPPIEGGDEYLQPLNMAPVGKPGTVPPPTPPAPPTPAPDPAARSLIEDAARRVLTKESKALLRAAKKLAGKPAELRTWADQFYAQHAALVARVFAAPLTAAGSNAKPEDYAREHCAASVRAIVAAIEAGATVDDLTDEWLDIRTAEIADQLTKGEDDHGKQAA